MEQNKRIFGLDLLRFIAISSVLYCHLYEILYPFFKGKAEVLYNLSRWLSGYYGVEIFFVLSGFLIGSIYIKTVINQTPYNVALWQQIEGFLLRRWIRTLPNYFLFILVNIAIVYIIKKSFHFDVLLPYVLFLQGLGITGSDFFYVSWSLAVEEWFYLLLPLFFFVAFFLSKNKKLSFFIAVSFLLAIPIFNKLWYAFQHSHSVARHDGVYRYATFYRIDAIGFGVLFSWFWMKESVKTFLTKNKNLLLLIGVFLLLCSFVYIYLFIAKSVQNPFIFAALSPLCCIAILFLFPATINMKVKQGTLFYKFVVLISLSSYSLYLCHVPVLQLAEYFVSHLLNMNNLLVAICYTMLYLIISIAIAHFIYRYFEQPILDKREAIILKFKNTL